MRQFFISFMGTLAGIWISVIIAMIGGLIIMGAAAAALGKSEDAMGSIEKSSILEINLSGQVEERESPYGKISMMMGDDNETISLDLFQKALAKAATDKSIEGVALKCGGISMGLAQAQEMLRAITEFKSSGKWVFAYGDQYTQGDYLLASAADSLFINPIGMLDLHGLSSTTMYFKNLLDKLGVEMQVVKVGTYKSAVEPYILTHMSAANEEQQRAFLGSMWKDIATTMGKGRGMTYDEINSLADSSSYTRPLEFLLKNNLVDAACYTHQFDSLLASKTNQEKARIITLDKYINARAITSGSSKGSKTIAVLYATGDITEDAEDGIASSRLVPAILDLAENRDIDGLILRVNSGGGSAFASEQIWEALEQFKKRTGRPFYVSMSDMAASGGYYISCGADKIFAEPTTLTGSIGIFGMIPNGQKLLKDHLGINTATVSTNPLGEAVSIFDPMTPYQRQSMQDYVNRGYELFVKRCADGRDMPVDSIKAIAEGRVWDGATALKLGLVDQLGGLENAIEEMTTLLEVKECKVQLYPEEEIDFLKEIRKSMSIISENLVKSQMGEFYPFYQSAKRINELDPIQCRTEYVVVH